MLGISLRPNHLSALFSHISRTWSCFDDINHTYHWAGLASLPRLTHLAFDNVTVNWCQQLLDSCKSLRVLVFLRRPSLLERTGPPVIEDPRFLMMPLGDYLRDWQRGVLTGLDFWMRA